MKTPPKPRTCCDSQCTQGRNCPRYPSIETTGRDLFTDLVVSLLWCFGIAAAFLLILAFMAVVGGPGR